jgi:2-oxoglutarate ferredoxin oxidoreductase subunit delta
MGNDLRCPEAVKGTASFRPPSLQGLSSQKTPMLTMTAQPASNNGLSAAPPAQPKALVSVLPELCKGCELCVYACPSGNLTLSPGLNSKGYHPAVFAYQGKRGLCTACGICYWVCPDMAISEIRRLKQ